MNQQAFLVMDQDTAQKMTEQMAFLQQEIELLKSRSFLKKEWYSREECAEMKNLSLTLVRNEPYLLPRFGKPHRLSKGKFGYHYTEVQAWLSKDYDQILEEYKEAKASKEI